MVPRGCHRGPTTQAVTQPITTAVVANVRKSAYAFVGIA